MNTGPTARTRLFALLGDPVEHSLSPIFQNAALYASGIDARYMALRCSTEALPALLRGVAEAGGGGNITVPHKEIAMRAVDRLGDAARRTGACNSFGFGDGGIWGDNTDVEGFRRALHALLGSSSSGMRVLLVGAGGAARAAVCALLDDGAASITVVNRSADRTRRLAAQFGSPTSLQLADRVPPDTFDLAVNATTLGLRAGDPLPLEPRVRAGAALDLVYTPEETPWVRRMRERGIPAADGREMLLQQGAAAFRLWFGQEPPMDVMQRALGLGG